VDNVAKGSDKDYCSSSAPDEPGHVMATHMRGGALASVRRCMLCGVDRLRRSR